MGCGVIQRKLRKEPYPVKPNPLSYQNNQIASPKSKDKKPKQFIQNDPFKIKALYADQLRVEEDLNDEPKFVNAQGQIVNDASKVRKNKLINARAGSYNIVFKAQKYDQVVFYWIQANQTVTFGVRGEWTIDRKNFPFVSCKGYDNLDKERGFNTGSLIGGILGRKDYFQVYDGVQHESKVSGPLVLCMNMNEYFLKSPSVNPEGKLHILLNNFQKIRNHEDLENKLGYRLFLLDYRLLKEMSSYENFILISLNKLRIDPKLFAMMYLTYQIRDIELVSKSYLEKKAKKARHLEDSSFDSESEKQEIKEAAVYREELFNRLMEMKYNLPLFSMNKNLLSMAKVHAKNLSLVGTKGEINSFGQDLEERSKRTGKKFLGLQEIRKTYSDIDNPMTLVIRILLEFNEQLNLSNADLLLNENSVFIGIACESHPESGNIIVIDLAEGIL